MFFVNVKDALMLKSDVEWEEESGAIVASIASLGPRQIECNIQIEDKTSYLVWSGALVLAEFCHENQVFFRKKVR